MFICTLLSSKEELKQLIQFYFSVVFSVTRIKMKLNDSNPNCFVIQKYSCGENDNWENIKLLIHLCTGFPETLGGRGLL